MMMFWYGEHWAWWQGGLMWAGMLLFWGLLIWGAYVLVTNLTRKPGPSDSGGDAQQILDQRLARGEISPEEYQRLRDLIGTGTGHAASGAGSRP